MRGNEWTRLGRAVIELPAWKRNGWCEIELTTTEKGVMVRSMGKTVTVNKALLGVAAGRYGLLVGSSRVLAAVEFRAAFSQ